MKVLLICFFGQLVLSLGSAGRAGSAVPEVIKDVPYQADPKGETNLEASTGGVPSDRRESDSQEYDYEPCNEGEDGCECLEEHELDESEDCQEGEEGCECEEEEYEECDEGEEDCECQEGGDNADEYELEECNEGEEGCECQEGEADDDEYELEECNEGEEGCECQVPPAYQPTSKYSLPAPSEPEEDVKDKALATGIIALINKERIKRRLPSLSTSEELNKVAQLHANDYFGATDHPNMLDWYSNGKCSGFTDSCMLSKPKLLANYPGKGYEIAYKATSISPNAIVKGIMRSRGSKNTILNRKEWRSKTWSHIGAATKDKHTWIWFGFSE